MNARPIEKPAATSFNFNAFEDTTFPVTINLRRQDMTLHLQDPSVEEYEDFLARASGEYDRSQQVKAMSMLVADMLSNNADGVEVEPSDLRHLKVNVLLAFVNDYFSWIHTMREAKN